jgi:hypothetical protein
MSISEALPGVLSKERGPVGTNNRLKNHLKGEKEQGYVGQDHDRKLVLARLAG